MPKYLLIAFPFAILSLFMVPQALQAQTNTDKTDAQYLQEWQQKNSTKFHRSDVKGRRRVIAGSIVAATGFACTISAMAVFFNFEKYSDAPDLRHRRIWSIGAPVMFAVGTPLFVTGATVALIGMVDLKRKAFYRNEAKRKGVQITYAPLVSPFDNTYGVNLAMKF